jgi:hypothetical protein
MRVLLLHPDDDFDGSWTRQHWDSVIDLGRAPKSFYGERSAELGCPVFSVFDLAIEVGDMQIWRHLFQPGMGRVVDGYGVDWWDVISVVLQSELQDVRLALRLAEMLSGCRTLAVSRPSAMAEALRQELGIPLQVVHRGLHRRVVQSVLRRGGAVTDLSFVQLRQVVYDKYDPHYRWRRKLAGSTAQSSKWEPESESVVLLPSAYSNVTKPHLVTREFCPSRNSFWSLPASLEPSRRFPQMCRRWVWRVLLPSGATGMNCRNLKLAGNRWSSRSKNIRYSGCQFRLGS